MADDTGAGAGTPPATNPYDSMERLHSYSDYVMLRKYVIAVNDILKKDSIIKSIASRTGRSELLSARRLTLLDINKIIKEFSVDYDFPRSIKMHELNRLGEYALKLARVAGADGFAKEDHVDQAFKTFVGTRKKAAEISEQQYTQAKIDLKGEKVGKKYDAEGNMSYGKRRETRRALGARVWADAKLLLDVGAIAGLSVAGVGVVGSTSTWNSLF